MKRRDLLTGGIALAAATILPAIPAMAMSKQQTYVLFTRYGHGYVTMRVFEGDMSSKKGMTDTKTKWSGNYLIKEDADMDMPRQSGEAVARMVKRHVAWVEDLKAQAIAYNESYEMMFRRARAMRQFVRQPNFGRLETLDVPEHDSTYFVAYDKQGNLMGRAFASGSPKGPVPEKFFAVDSVVQA